MLPFYHGDFFLYNRDDDGLEPVVSEEPSRLDGQIHTSSPDARVGGLPLDHPVSPHVGAVGSVVDHLGHYHLAGPRIFEPHSGATGQVPVSDADVFRSEFSVEADSLTTLQFVVLPSKDRCVAWSRGGRKAREECDQRCD